jgi:hypothetical protein
MVAAGDPISAADANVSAGIAQLTADSATWTTTESASLLSVSANLVNTKQYWIMLITHVSTSTVISAAAPTVEFSAMRVRETSASGTQLMAIQNTILNNSATGFMHFGFCKYTATTTGAVQFHVTGQRIVGAGNHQIRAGGSRPTVLRVDKIT